MRRLVILGASGSIGTQTMDVVSAYPDKFEIVGLSVNSNVSKLEEYLNKFKVPFVCLGKENKELEKKYPNTTFFYGDEGLVKLAELKDYDMLVNAVVGFPGFIPTLHAIENKKDIALANKETLVAGGDIINAAIDRNGVMLTPIDSEHSAIFQCLDGHKIEDVKRIIITASGGSFRNKSRDELVGVGVKEALNHPNWSMGAKITIDSATMMNKGFEVIEAHHLFRLPYSQIETILHYESAIHSLVEYKDGAMMAELDSADMHTPISIAISYPEKVARVNDKYLDLAKMGTMTFKEMDYVRFPLLKKAYEVGEKGGNMGAALVGANDAAVKLFLEEKIEFLDIEKNIFECLDTIVYNANPTASELIETHKLAYNYVMDKNN